MAGTGRDVDDIINLYWEPTVSQWLQIYPLKIRRKVLYQVYRWRKRLKKVKYIIKDIEITDNSNKWNCL